MMHNNGPKFGVLKSQVVAAVNEIFAHNLEFNSAESMGRELAQALASVIGKENSGGAGEVFRRAEPAIQELMHSHRTPLLRAGFVIDEGSDYSIAVHLAHPERAVEFLSKLHRSDVSIGGVVAELAKTVEPTIRGIAELLRGDSLVHFVRELDRVSEEFIRLGAGSHLKGAFALIEAAEKGFLEEQLRVDAAGLMRRGSFGPTLWHTDSTPQALYSRWMESLAILREIRGNMAASQLAGMLEVSLSGGLEKFGDDLDGWEQGNSPYPEAAVRQFRGVHRLISGHLKAIREE